jgi:DNA replication protein DnaC
MGQAANNLPKPKQANCDHHGVYESKSYRRGFGAHAEIGWTDCPKCGQEAEERAKRKEIQIAADGHFSRSQIPKRYLEASLENYRTDCGEQEEALNTVKRYVDQFEDRLKEGGSMLLCGTVGTGKTHLACAIAVAVMYRYGKSARYTTFFDAASHVKSTWQNSGEREQEAMKSYIDPTLLVMDEVGIQYNSDVEKLIIYNILNGRYVQMLPTIIISNLPVEQLQEFITIQCLDRLKEGGGALINFTWNSYRK